MGARINILVIVLVASQCIISCLAESSECIHFYNAKESEGCNTDVFNIPTNLGLHPAGIASCHSSEMNLRCNNGICVRGPYKPGDKCLFDSQCVATLPRTEMFCNTTCKFANYIEAGATCTHDKQCYSGTCSDGKCRSVAKDSECSTDFDCDYGLACHEKKCVEITEGSSCLNNFSCGSSMQCVEAKCQKVHTKKLNEDCGNNLDCSMGLLCSDKKCLAVEYTAKTDCKECTEKGGACECDPSKGDKVCVPNRDFAPNVYFDQETRDTCNNMYQSLTACMTENKCRAFSLLPQSCVMTNCDYMMRCYLGCTGSYYYSPAKYAGAYSVECVMPVDNTYNYAWTGIIGGILVIGFGFTAYYFIRKRRNMTPVRVPDQEAFMAHANDL